jgi:hypothetical protein
VEERPDTSTLTKIAGRPDHIGRPTPDGRCLSLVPVTSQVNNTVLF